MTNKTDSPYRPTVRYAPIYKEYVNDLFHATTLDRSQIIRAALFTAAHSPEFLAQLKPHLKRDVPIPSPRWNRADTVLWREQSPQLESGEGDVTNESDHRARVTEGNVEPVATTTDRTQEATDPPKPGRIRSLFKGGITLKL
ncbi:hypothetical protein MM326_06845 [Alkalihalobacillus sp. LMS6]|uniref:hypothetical protein n=1 Tax=Alkalihalobacillus sp. LMS6 TaxID=2924034 RepID=UPI0020D0AF10|nr:hypothetical protein [Alkalihalobacillus sp. LMS6]UTR07725.1 hypothetical protein MM326_06845 [Alkalihalobacillus sp. LMS6]